MKKKNGGRTDDGINNVIEMINKLISEPYYLLHLLTFFSYIPVRLVASQFLSPHFTSHLLHREIQAILAFSVLTVVKIVKEETWEGFIADTLFFAKMSMAPWYGEVILMFFASRALAISPTFGVFLAAIALVLDYHLALWFTLVFLVIYVSTQQPAYTGLGTSNQLTPLQLEALLTEGSTSRYWLVELRNLSSSTCIRTSRIFPDLSITFSNKHLSFGIVDLGLFPNTSEKFGISLGRTEQLPTYILFENGEEVTRFPELDFESKIFNPSITKKLLCRHFELDRLLLEYVKGK